MSNRILTNLLGSYVQLTFGMPEPDKATAEDWKLMEPPREVGLFGEVRSVYLSSEGHPILVVQLARIGKLVEWYTSHVRVLQHATTLQLVLESDVIRARIKRYIGGE